MKGDLAQIEPTPAPAPPRAVPLHPAETGATTAVRAGTPVAALLAGHVLRDGEVVQLIIRPSLWFIALTSLNFIVAVAMIVAALAVHHPSHAVWYLQVGIFLAAGRLMIATLRWMGRLYILTDYRVLRLSGVFSVEVFDCPLRKVARAALYATMRERVVRIGSIEIQPMDSSKPSGLWQMIARPRQVHEKMLAVIERAKQGHGNGQH